MVREQSGSVRGQARDRADLGHIEGWALKLNWTRPTVIPIRLGATLGDDHGGAEAQVWALDNLNATVLGGFLVGCGWVVRRGSDPAPVQLGRVRDGCWAVLPKYLDLCGVGVKHSEGHLALFYSTFFFLESHPSFAANQWFQVCNIFFRFWYSPRFDCTFLFLSACRAFSPAPSFFLLTLTCPPVYSIPCIQDPIVVLPIQGHPSSTHPRVEHHDDDCWYPSADAVTISGVVPGLIALLSTTSEEGIENLEITWPQSVMLLHQEFSHILN